MAVARRSRIRPLLRSSSPRSSSTVLTVLTFFTLLSFLPGCGGDTTTCPAASGGFVGTVTAGGRPFSAKLIATSVGLGGGRRIEAQAEIDSSGVYRLYVPAGRYSLTIMTSDQRFLLGPDGLVFDDTDARILTAEDGSPSRVDIRAAALTLRFTLGYGYAAERISASLWTEELGWLIQTSLDSIETDVVDLRFAPVPPGRYRATFDLRSRESASDFWFPGVYEPSDAAWIDVGADGEPIVQCTLGTPGRLVGTFTGASRDFGISPQIDLVTDTRHWYVGSADPRNGAFAIQIVSPVRVKVKITTKDISRWYGGWEFDEGTTFDLRPGLTLPLEIRDCGIEGTFDRKGYVNTAVYSPDGKLLGEIDNATDDGKLRLANLPTGAYKLHFSRGPTWVDQWYAGADTIAAATPVTLSRDGDIAHLDIHLVDGGGIRGRIEGPDGTPLAGADVEALEAPYYFRQFSTTSDTSGDFHIQYVPNGDYLVRARYGGLPDTWYPGVTDPYSATTVVVRHFQTVGGIDFGFGGAP